MTAANRIWYPRTVPSQPPPEGTFVFLSELIGRPARGASGERLGKVVDFLADASEPAYPKVTALRVKVPSLRGEVKRVEWADVASCEPSGTRLKRGAEALQPLKLQGNEIPLAQDVLDRQIVDTDDAKVERVNDLHLLRARGDLRVAHVDVGFRGLVRRMGWQPAVDALLKRLKPGSPYLRREQFVPWKHVQPLAAGTSKVRLDLARRAMAEVHPSDLAEILEDLDRRERAVLFRDLPIEFAADALEESEPGLQRELLRMVEPSRAADIVEKMQPDDAADMLSELPKEQTAEILAAMDPPDARVVEELLTYDENTAGRMMNTEFLRLQPAMTAQQALSAVRDQAREVAQVHDCFVVQRDRRLLGVLSLRDLLLAAPEAPVDAIMHEHPAPLEPEDRAGKVAELAAKYNLFSLPVERDGKLLGVVTVDDVLEKVLHG
ncbi:MAG: CBS domain-containing protein [Myxococcales bacterium]|nr:CBS domain-containing protein [Myxococcales bacterium]